MGILNTLQQFLQEAKAGDTVTSAKGKKVEVIGSQKGREKVVVKGKEFTPEDKYTVKVKNAKGEVKEKTKKKAAKYTKYVDKVKEKEPSKVTNTKEEEKAKNKAEEKKKGGRKAEKKWWQDENEFKKVMSINPEAKKATKKAIDKIRETDISKENEEPKKKLKKVAESVYPADPKAIKQIISEYFEPQKEEVRNFFK